MIEVGTWVFFYNGFNFFITSIIKGTHYFERFNLIFLIVCVIEETCTSQVAFAIAVDYIFHKQHLFIEGISMDQLVRYVNENQERFLSELRDFLAIPSVSSQPDRKSELWQAAEWLAHQLRAIGIPNVEILETDGNPIVFGELFPSSNAPTILIYGHYDVQPEDPINEWDSPPFEATIKDGRLYARGATDDKGQLFIHLKALESYLKNGIFPPVNIKLIFEGEEEIGSEHLPLFLSQHKDLLACDVVLISDSSMFAKGIPSVTYGLRGLCYAEVEVTGPNSDLHSGSYGGALHNPIQALAEIIASLHDAQGRVTIKGFYDSVLPLTKNEREAFALLPWSDNAYAKKLGVRQLYGEKGYTTLERLWARPTLECNGIIGGYTGQGAKTVLPARALAKISMRLVPNQKSDVIAKLFRKHIQSIAPKTVKVNVRILSAGEPALTPISSSGVQTAVAALEKAFGKKPLYQREGGSIPIVVDFKKILGADSVLLGFGLPDENAHAPNEFLDLDNFFKGIVTCIYYYKDFPQYYKKQSKRK